MQDNHQLLIRLIRIFCFLLVLGTALTLPLYKFNVKKFIKSMIFIKILFWVPIFLIFLAAIFSPGWLSFIILLAIMLGICVEIAKKFNLNPKLLLLYAAILIFCLLHFIFINNIFPEKFMIILITLGFATVLSDVFAFFMGNYLGAHKLPKVLNDRKSWEGVAGEVIGALFGVLLVKYYVFNGLSFWIFIPIGLGSALGDLANSFVKRSIDIKQWSNYIPGHGGFTDRFSSLAGSSLLTFYFLFLTSY